MIRFLGLLCSWTFIVWQWSSIAIYVAGSISPDRREALRRSVLGWIRYELMPVRYLLVVVAYLADMFTSHARFNYWESGALALNLWFCWFYRQKDDEDDDRWKKRRQKLASKVAEVGGRLQVVPAGAS